MTAEDQFEQVTNPENQSAAHFAAELFRFVGGSVMAVTAVVGFVNWLKLQPLHPNYLNNNTRPMSTDPALKTKLIETAVFFGGLALVIMGDVLENRGDKSN